jgi:surface protein
MSDIIKIDLAKFNFEEVEDMSMMFRGCENLEIIKFGEKKIDKVKNLNGLFYNCKSLSKIVMNNFDTSLVTDMKFMFYNCSNLVKLNLSRFNTYKVQSMENIFLGCISLKSLDVRNFYFNKLNHSINIFNNLKNINYINASNVKFSTPNISYLFYNLVSLTSIDLSNMDTSSVTNMEHLFDNCIGLISLDISKIDTSKVQIMDYMFKNCKNLEYVNFRNINITSTKSMGNMFFGCIKLQKLNIYSYKENLGMNIDNIFRKTSNNFSLCLENFKSAPSLSFEVISLNITRDCSQECYNDSRYYNEYFRECNLIRELISNPYPYPTTPTLIICDSGYCREGSSCVPVVEGVKVVEGVCVQIQNLKDFGTTQNGDMVINSYPASADKDEFLKDNPDLTYVDLGDCGKALKKANNLPDDAQLYVLSVDDVAANSSLVNGFEYEIYLENGTKIVDMSPCNSLKIIVSSKIKDLDSANFKTATEMSDLGFDIYDKNDPFYTDYCTSVSQGGNDVAINDRKDFCPTQGLCNEGCVYEGTDFENERINCNCNPDEIEAEEEAIEVNEDNYVDYILSYVNYKLIFCYVFLKDIENYKGNYGFIVGASIFGICLSSMVIFFTYGLYSLKLIIYKNIPSGIKVQKEIKENLQQHKINIKNNKGKKSKFKSNPVIKPSSHSTQPKKKIKKPKK